MRFDLQLPKVVFLIVVLAGLLGVPSRSPAQGTVERSATTSYLYQLNSLEATQVLQWLELHPGFRGGQMAVDVAELESTPTGKIKVIITEPRTPLWPGPSITPTFDDPPVPLPASGTPGQTITIIVTTGSRVQSWTYEWVSNSSGGSWVLTDYEDHNPVRTGPRQ